MSHLVTVPDDLYARLIALAAKQGLPIEQVVADLPARELAVDTPTASGRLNWATSSAEDIIADLQAIRVERELPAEL